MFTTKQKAFISDIFAEMFDSLSKTCKLIYPPTTEYCVNCVYDSIGKKSSNHYKHGGPAPFQQSICPMCGGEGQRATENSEDITCVLYWKPSKFLSVNDNIRTPNQQLEIKILITDYPKLKKAEFIIIQTSALPYQTFRCRLSGEPVDNHNIIQDKYMLARLERIG